MSRGNLLRVVVGKDLAFALRGLALSEIFERPGGTISRDFAFSAARHFRIFSLAAGSVAIRP